MPICNECEQELERGKSFRGYWCSPKCRAKSQKRWFKELYEWREKERQRIENLPKKPYRDDEAVGGQAHYDAFEYDDSHDVHTSLTGGDRWKDEKR